MISTIDLRQALRGLWRHRAYALPIVLCVGVGLGVAAGLASVADDLLLRPPPHVARASETLRVYERIDDSLTGVSVSASTSFPRFAQLRTALDGVAGVAAYAKRSAVIGRGASARRVDAVLATDGYFELLGVRPHLGRLALPDGRDGQGTVAVLGFALWQHGFGGDADIVGRTIHVDGVPATVIGVAPRHFNGAELTPVGVWLSLTAAAAQVAGPDWRTDAGSAWLAIIARRDGRATASQVERALGGFRPAEAAPGGMTVTLLPGPLLLERGPLRSAGVRTAGWLGALAFLIWMIACANAAQLLVGRTVERRDELATRIALGGSRTQVGRLLALDSALLMLLATVLATVLGFGTRLLAQHRLAASGATLPDTPSWHSVPLLGAALLLATACLVGAAWGAARSTLTWGRRGGIVRSGPRVKGGLRRALVALQVALTMVLMTCAGLFIRSLERIRSLDIGIDPARVLIAAPELAEGGYHWREVEPAAREALARLQRLPGVAAAASSTTMPFGGAYGIAVFARDHDGAVQTRTGTPYVNAVSPDYFRVVGTKIIAGRAFTAADDGRAPLVAVVSRAMARIVWGTRDAIGQCIYVGTPDAPCTRVIGVAGDARRTRIMEDTMLALYLPSAQSELEHVARTFLVRGSDAPVPPPTVRAVLHDVFPRVPYVLVRPYQELVAAEHLPWRLGSEVFTLMGGLALGIAVCGYYSVLAAWIAGRTREIAIHAAVGATHADVVRMVLAQTAGPVAVGVAAGGLASAGVARLIGQQLYGLVLADATIYLVCVLILIGTAALACVVPVRRALRINVREALVAT